MKWSRVKTVDDALAALSGALDDLDTVRDEQFEKSAEATRKILGLEVERDVAYREGERASRVGGKIRELLS